MGVLLVNVNACTSVPIHDETVCGDLGPQGASCFHTLSSESYDLDKQAWDSQREGMLCLSQTTFGDFKEELEKLCSLSNACAYDSVKKTLEEITLKIQAIGLKP